MASQSLLLLLNQQPLNEAENEVYSFTDLGASYRPWCLRDLNKFSHYTKDEFNN